MFFRKARGWVKSRWGCGHDFLTGFFLISGRKSRGSSVQCRNTQQNATTALYIVFWLLTHDDKMMCYLRKFPLSFSLSLFFRKSRGCVKSPWGSGHDFLTGFFLICCMKKLKRDVFSVTKYLIKPYHWFFPCFLVSNVRRQNASLVSQIFTQFFAHLAFS